MTKYMSIEGGASLKMSFPYETDKNKCEIEIKFHRTLRISDDNKKYNLPPSLGSFPLEHVDDYKDSLPESWVEHGGVFFPMYQSEAMWMSFSSVWPFAVKIASGKINAVSGKEWSNKLEGEREGEQDYVVVPSQPWIDGFNVSKGVIRQFVCVPLNSDFTVEKQVSGESEIGGVQIMVFPMKKEEFLKIENPPRVKRYFAGADFKLNSVSRGISGSTEMGLGAGGFMKQEIYKDKYGIDKWSEESQRVFVHLLNSMEYEKVTGKKPPTRPLNPKDYEKYNYTWYDYYSDEKVMSGSKELSNVKSVAELEVLTGEKILEDNSSFDAASKIVEYINAHKVKNGKW